MADIHLLTTPGPDLRQVTVACKTRLPEYGSWDARAVTCNACLSLLRQQRRSPSGSRERDLQEMIRQACTLQGWLYYHTHDSRHSPSGFIDTVAVRGQRLLCAELKRPGQQPTPEQAQWFEAFQQVQEVETYLWYPDDLDTILEVLR